MRLDWHQVFQGRGDSFGQFWMGQQHGDDRRPRAGAGLSHRVGQQCLRRTDAYRALGGAAQQVANAQQPLLGDQAFFFQVFHFEGVLRREAMVSARRIYKIMSSSSNVNTIIVTIASVRASVRSRDRPARGGCWMLDGEVISRMPEARDGLG